MAGNQNHHWSQSMSYYTPQKTNDYSYMLKYMLEEEAQYVTKN